MELVMVYSIVSIIATEKVSYRHNTLITSHNSYYRNTKKKIVEISICHICCTLYAKRLSDIIVFDTFLVLL